MYTSALKLTCSPLLKLKWSKENSALRVADKQPKKLRDPFSGPLKHDQRRSVESISVFAFHIRWGGEGQFHRESGEPCIRAFNIGKLSDHDLLSVSLKAECHPSSFFFFTLHRPSTKVLNRLLNTFTGETLFLAPLYAHPTANSAVS